MSGGCGGSQGSPGSNGSGSNGSYPGPSLTVTPSAVCAPCLTKGQSTVPNTANILAVLYTGVNFFAGEATVVQVWDSSSQMATIRADLMALLPIQLSLNQSLMPGSYSLVLYDASKVKPPYTYNWQAGTEAIGPMLDDDNNQAFIDYMASFQVTASGKISAQQMNVVFGSLGQTACANAGAIDPLTINLGSAPISLSSQLNGVSINLAGNPSAQRISWFNQPEVNALLVNLSDGAPAGGVIGPSQIFGNFTVGPDGQTAANGYDALAKYDSNGDGVIDSNDSIWDSLRIWKDLNHNGIADAGELISLSDAGITSIELPQNGSSSIAKEKCTLDSFGNITCQGHGAYVNFVSNGVSVRKPLVDIGFKPLSQ
jgi:hypothetical protein